MAAVKLVHLSDTHNMHWLIERKFPVPPGDIFVHTGDFTDGGREEEFADFLTWLHSIKDRFESMLLIAGNHDWWDTLNKIEEGSVQAKDAAAPGFLRRKLERCGPGLPQNCKLLDHEGVHAVGLRIWGSPWCPWQPGNSSARVADRRATRLCFDAWQGESHRFAEVPVGLDVLLTHGPAADIMDCVGTPGRGWGSSRELRDAIYRARPRMHLFGHLHEQRGEWRKATLGFEGGIEYVPRAGAPPFVTTGPPPPDYPCELVSCNAMANHPGIEGKQPHIAGPARQIFVEVAILVDDDEDAPEAAVAQPCAVQPAGQQLQQYRILNVRRRQALATSGAQVGTALGEGRWLVLPCPHEAGTVYIVEATSGMFLDTHGQDVQVWNNNGQSIAEVIAGNISQFAGNLRWRIAHCPHESFISPVNYIINVRHSKFLDAVDGTNVQVWNANGRSIDEVIRGNTSRHAGNLRWSLQPVA